MKNEIFTREDLELAFSAGYDYAEDSFNNPDNTEYVNERVALKQANGAEQSSSNCNIPLVSQQSEQLAIAALDKIAHPIKYLQSEAEKEGAKLDGYMAIQITQDANFYQEIADKALKAIANCG